MLACSSESAYLSPSTVRELAPKTVRVPLLVLKASDMVNNKEFCSRSNGFFISGRGLYVAMTYDLLDLLNR